MAHRFACWRFRVWSKRLARRRAIWLSSLTPATEPVWEALVTKALAKRVKWKKRACENCRRRVLRSAP